MTKEDSPITATFSPPLIDSKEISPVGYGLHIARISQSFMAHH
jgi:hypothetical protein